MTQPTAKKKKRTTTASVQSVSAFLRIPLDAVMDLIKRGKLKARRNRNRLQVDVMHPHDEYAINFDSVLLYRELEKQAARKNIKPESAA